MPLVRELLVERFVASAVFSKIVIGANAR